MVHSNQYVRNSRFQDFYTNQFVALLYSNIMAGGRYNLSSKGLTNKDTHSASFSTLPFLSEEIVSRNINVIIPNFATEPSLCYSSNDGGSAGSCLLMTGRTSTAVRSSWRALRQVVPCPQMTEMLHGVVRECCHWAPPRQPRRRRNSCKRRSDVSRTYGRTAFFCTAKFNSWQRLYLITERVTVDSADCTMLFLFTFHRSRDCKAVLCWSIVDTPTAPIMIHNPVKMHSKTLANHCWLKAIRK